MSVRWENEITQIQEKVLIYLAKYKYLTLKQLLRFEDIGTSQYTYLWRQVSSLRDRKMSLVDCNSFNTPNPRKGRVHSIYFLNSRGKKFLENELGFDPSNIRYKTGKYLTTSQYSHRLLTVEFHIQLSRSAKRNNQRLSDFVAYYDSNNEIFPLRRKLKVSHRDKNFTPDAAFNLVKKDNKTFFLFELYNGKDLSFIKKQLIPHLEEFIEGSVHKSFDLPKVPYYLLLLFRSKKVMVSIQDFLYQKKDLRSIFNFILLNYVESEEDIRDKSFFSSWQNTQGKLISI